MEKEKEEKRRRKRKREGKEREKKEGDGLYLKGAPDLRHAPTRDARKIFGPFFG